MPSLDNYTCNWDGGVHVQCTCMLYNASSDNTELNRSVLIDLYNVHVHVHSYMTMMTCSTCTTSHSLISYVHFVVFIIIRKSTKLKE